MSATVDGYYSALNRQMATESKLELVDFVGVNEISAGFFIVSICSKAWKVVFNGFLGLEGYPLRKKDISNLHYNIDSIINIIDHS